MTVGWWSGSGQYITLADSPCRTASCDTAQVNTQFASAPASAQVWWDSFKFSGAGNVGNCGGLRHTDSENSASRTRGTRADSDQESVDPDLHELQRNLICH